jgi:hypothetical protein
MFDDHLSRGDSNQLGVGSSRSLAEMRRELERQRKTARLVAGTLSIILLSLLWSIAPSTVLDVQQLGQVERVAPPVKSGIGMVSVIITEHGAYSVRGMVSYHFGDHAELRVYDNGREQLCINNNCWRLLR